MKIREDLNAGLAGEMGRGDLGLPRMEVGDGAKPAIVGFPTTQWTVLVEARRSDGERSVSAIADLCKMYWRPLYVYVRRKGIRDQEAEDLTQSFLENFLKREQFCQANRALGRFRCFLLRSFENFLHNDWRRRWAQKRGGGLVPVSLDAQTPDELLSGAHLAETPSVAYEREWARAVLNAAIERLQLEWEQAGRAALCEAFLAHLWSDTTATPFLELSARFDLTPVNLRVSFHRFRKRYRDLLRDTISQTVGSEAEVEEELRHLIQSVSR